MDKLNNLTKNRFLYLIIPMKHVLVCLLCFFSLHIYAQTPDWLDLNTSKYPKQQYEIAVGEGSTLAYAEQNAIGNLSRIFGISVDTDSTSKLQLENNALEKSASQSTSVHSSHNLVNASIAETAYDKNKDIFYALAVMPRVETVAIIKKMITENDEIIADYLESAEYETDSLYKYSFINSSVELAEKNEVLFNQHTILSQELSRTDNEELEYSANRLKSELRSVVRNFGISVQVENDEGIASALEAAIVDMGMLVNRTNPTYVLNVVTTYTGSTSSFGVYLLQYVSTIELLYADGSVITTFTYSGKDGGRTQEAAETVMFNRLARLITEGDADDNILPFTMQFMQFLQELVN